MLLFLYKIYGEERSQNGTIEDGGIPYLLNHLGLSHEDQDQTQFDAVMHLAIKLYGLVL